MKDTRQSINNESEVYLCSGCGANMEYDISEKKLKCKYCSNTEEIIDVGNIREYDFNTVDDEELNSKWNDEVEVVKCEACGAETIIDKHATSAKCSYCASSHVLNTKQTAGIRPEGVLPFSIDRHKAEDLVRGWMKRRWLAPNDLKHLYESEKLQPVYVPYWTYDSNTYSRYSGQGGKTYYVTVERDGKKHTEARIRWYHVSGNVNLFFDDVLVNASDNYDQVLMNEIETFNTKAIKSYNPQYLSGYSAERYHKGVKHCFEFAKAKMQNDIENRARGQILMRYDHARVGRVDTTYNNITYKHVLLPIWSAYYSYRGNKYQYLINGQTGEVQGQAPTSWVKITIIVLIVIMIIVFIVMGQ